MRLANEKSKGMAAAGVDEEYAAWSKRYDEYAEDFAPDGWTGVLYSNAYGLGYVPFDGYPAILHQGERVLTAAESRSLEAAGRAWESAPAFAFGLRAAPTDNFPAILHQGERVLTAQEARAGGQRAVNVTVNVTGNTVRSEEDLDILAERFAAAIQEKALLFGG